MVCTLKRIPSGIIIVINTILISVNLSINFEVLDQAVRIPLIKRYLKNSLIRRVSINVTSIFEITDNDTIHNVLPITGPV